MPLSPSYPEAIRPLLQCINEAVQPEDPSGSGSDNSCSPFRSEAARRSVVAAAEQLLLAARSPEENVFAIAQQPAQTTALRCAIALGIPDALPEDGTARSLDSLAGAVGADSMLLGRILRACTSTALLAEAGELHYAHNALSRVLLSPANRALLTLMFDYNARSVVALPEFLRARDWRDAGSPADCAFMLACRTALPMWDFRDRDPECAAVFDLGMQSALVAALSTGAACGPFPFADELAPRPAAAAAAGGGGGGGGAGGRLTIVDLGGGRGQALVDLHDNHPQLLQRARLVLVDLGPVIDSAREAGLPPWVEPLKGSFFEPLPVRDADVYLLRRCLHNWNDAACARILRNLAAAMHPAWSRLLITDMVVADTNAAREMAWEDLNMMTIGGIERTERHWRALLDECGFRVHRIWSHSPVEHATIDARLK